MIKVKQFKKKIKNKNHLTILKMIISKNTQKEHQEKVKLNHKFFKDHNSKIHLWIILKKKILLIQVNIFMVETINQNRILKDIFSLRVKYHKLN